MSATSANVISSTIIIFVAAALILGGSLIRHSDTKLFIQFAGSAIGILGIGGWLISFNDNRKFRERHGHEE